ncbi:hypothetical protein EGR_09460 [Echinococcus granulosus]|uniref:Uncharacterized protein n=1 Tax=Echinococcus granulosus TaxID=6210 RepID=W6U3K8_ECHGR|nr:hypothetical protein EGR_09460 [Echinococcus granulosus]EUB55700.1 hypothetical protein EGR_09460 [Echinococcus granulosus]
MLSEEQVEDTTLLAAKPPFESINDAGLFGDPVFFSLPAYCGLEISKHPSPLTHHKFALRSSLARYAMAFHSSYLQEMTVIYPLDDTETSCLDDWKAVNINANKDRIRSLVIVSRSRSPVEVEAASSVKAAAAKPAEAFGTQADGGGSGGVLIPSGGVSSKTNKSDDAMYLKSVKFFHPDSACWHHLREGYDVVCLSEGPLPTSFVCRDDDFHL